MREIILLATHDHDAGPFNDQDGYHTGQYTQHERSFYVTIRYHTAYEGVMLYNSDKALVQGNTSFYLKPTAIPSQTPESTHTIHPLLPLTTQPYKWSTIPSIPLPIKQHHNYAPHQPPSTVDMTPMGILQQLNTTAWIEHPSTQSNNYYYYYQSHAHLINFMPPSTHYLVIKQLNIP